MSNQKPRTIVILSCGIFLGERKKFIYFKSRRGLSDNLSVDNYAIEVYRELRQALIGLVEEE